MMERVVGRSGRNKRPRTTKVSEPELDALIEEATVDTYNESEQMMGFHADRVGHLLNTVCQFELTFRRARLRHM